MFAQICFLAGGALSGIGFMGWAAGSNVWAPRIGMVGLVVGVPAMLGLGLGGAAPAPDNCRIERFTPDGKSAGVLTTPRPCHAVR